MSSPEYNPLSLVGRRYLITGASSGIGRAVALSAARLGATVAAVGRDSARLDEALKTLPGSGHVSVPFDLRDTEAIPGWVRGVTDRGGPLHGLVHAAGVQSLLPLELTCSKEVREIWGTNAEAALALARGFRQRGVYAGRDGSVVFISSVAGLVGAPANSAYAMSKGALHAMTRSLALELARARIRVNCVAPAMVRTPMMERMFLGWSDAQREHVERMHPLGFGDPEDVAGAVAFLLADTGRWVTGSVLVVDGGYTAG